MRRFLASAWFPLLAMVVMAGVTAGAFAMLQPTGEDIGYSEIVRFATIAGWAAGPVIGLLSLILIFLLNGLRRLFRVRRVRLLHPVMILLAIAPWLVMAWQITGEPLYTPIARAVIPFVARPMLWGTFAATLFTLILSLGLLLPSRDTPAKP